VNEVVGMTKCTLALLVLVVVVGDAAEALGQSLLGGDHGRVLLAEAGRRARRQRAQKAAPATADPGQADAAEPPETGDSAQPAAESGAVNGGGKAGDARASGEGEGDGFGAEEGGGEQGFSEKIEGSEGSSLRRSNRMDFDERLVKGQGARSGAVYLFKRTPRKLPELVALRTTYRRRIVDPVLGDRGLPQPAPGPTKVEEPAPAAGPEPEQAEVEPQAEKAPATKGAIRRRNKRRRVLRRGKRQAAQKKAQ
jgi:hypothetical protein